MNEREYRLPRSGGACSEEHCRVCGGCRCDDMHNRSNFHEFDPEPLESQDGTAAVAPSEGTKE